MTTPLTCPFTPRDAEDARRMRGVFAFAWAVCQQYPDARAADLANAYFRDPVAPVSEPPAAALLSDFDLFSSLQDLVRTLGDADRVGYRYNHAHVEAVASQFAQLVRASLERRPT